MSIIKRRCIRNGILYEYDDSINGPDWIIGKGFVKIRTMNDQEFSDLVQVALSGVKNEPPQD